MLLFYRFKDGLSYQSKRSKVTPIWKTTVSTPNKYLMEENEKTDEEKMDENYCPHLSPLHMTVSQVESFADTTLTQIALSNTPQTHAVATPTVTMPTNQRPVCQQAGTIVSSREGMKVVRIPLIKLAEGREKLIRHSEEKVLI